MAHHHRTKALKAVENVLDENKENNYFQRQFVDAVKQNDLMTLGMILKEYPDDVVDVESEYGFDDDETAIRYAIKTNRPKLVKMLLEDNCIKLDNGDCCLTVAVTKDYHIVLNILLNDWRVKTTLKKSKLNELIQLANKLNHFKCVDLLLEFRFDYPIDNHNEYKTLREQRKVGKVGKTTKRK